MRELLKGIYAFSGDPITYGHIDIIKRAAALFDRLIVGIGLNPQKSYTFSLDDRNDMARRVLQHMENVEVISFQGLLVDYAYRNNIEYIVRGLRNIRDFDYEAEIALSNLSQNRGIDTVPFFSRPELMHCSSSMAKGLQQEMGNVIDYVPMLVKSRLEEVLSGQFRVTLTGSIASGKTEVSRRLVRRLAEQGVQAYDIDMDDLTRRIYTSELPGYRERLSDQFAETFGQSVINTDGSINRAELAKVVYGDGTGRMFSALDRLMKEPLETELRQCIHNKTGLILINAAIAPERNWLTVSNNNVILVHTDLPAQIDRLCRRNGLTRTEAEQRITRQLGSDGKRGIIRELQERDRFGRLIEFDNNGELTDDKINRLMAALRDLFPDLFRGSQYVE